MHRTHPWPGALFSFLVALGGCSAGTKAPVVSNEPNLALGLADKAKQSTGSKSSNAKKLPPFHIVARGETLSLIAWQYERDYREIAAWNKIKAPYIIYPSQRLKLAPSTLEQGKREFAAKPAPPSLLVPAPKSREKSPKPPLSPAPTRQRSLPPPNPTVNTEAQPHQSLDPQLGAAEPEAVTQTKGGIRWQWPANGKVEAASSTRGTKGVNIFGSRGQVVKAAAPGEIVYSGSGLTGYGKLIIVKHDENYLSAYAHNNKLLRKEGDKVAAGQPIAEMGKTGAKHTMLHFEIRRSGKPVNPLDYLPKL
ncbi:MAG: peptidoglycan DD-metalloendopeptidase family protein [Gammaproteobacteria bacterium]